MAIEMKNIRVNWGDLPIGSMVTTVNDEGDLHVFKGEKLVLYAILDQQQPEKDKQV